MARYNNDPRRLNARFPGTCKKCGKPYKKGDSIFWYPSTKATYSGECANEAEADFFAAAEDEDFFAYGT